jgi:hypothetical protein
LADRRQKVWLTGPVVRHAGVKEPRMSSQQPLPVAVKTPAEGAAGMSTSAWLHPGVCLQSPRPSGGDTHTVTSVGCASGAHFVGVSVALTALPPPGTITSCGDDKAYWQPADSEESSGVAYADGAVPPALARTAVSNTEASTESRRIIIEV